MGALDPATDLMDNKVMATCLIFCLGAMQENSPADVPDLSKYWATLKDGGQTK
jgi:hypothetical protein